MSSELLSTEDLADLLGVPVRTVYAWRRNGTGPRAIRVGKHLRFRREDVERWLDAHADAPEPAA